MRTARRLHIAIDATAIPRQMAGAGVYTYEIIRAVAAENTQHSIIVFTRAGLFEDLASERKIHQVVVEPPWRGARLTWEQTVLPTMLRRLRIDVLHSPHHHTPVLSRALFGAHTKRVVTVHDLTFILIPERYPIARRLFMEGVTRASARTADAVITPSQTVRRQVIDRLGLRPERVVAIPEAASSSYRKPPRMQVDEVLTRYGVPEPYILSVGSLEPGKNRTRLLRAFSELRGRGIECSLVIVGQPAWKYEGDYDLVHKLGLGGYVHFLGYVPDIDMPPLYTGASVFAFPSLFEGFGLPVLEAMACGAPVVTSNVSATAEIGADATLLIDPYDTGAITSALESVLTNEALRRDLRERGLRRAAQFSWERAARETLLVYELTAAG
jgi:glycosyltransferase involved in cell wall biosynthesis